jgi:uncharacterized surface protein with fasciclin (FAS1) repeats
MNKRKSIISVLATASLVLAACGGDDDDTTDTTEVAVETTEAAADTTEPAADTTEPAADTTEPPAPDEGDIIAVATAAGSFNTLAAALEAANLVETLQGEGPFTVFAPTDEAFAALPDGLVDALLLPENVDVLTDILLFHVIAGSEITSGMVAPGDVEMANGGLATIVIEDGIITIAGAEIVGVDVEASNGVIHVLDAVMVPANIDVNALLAG